MEQAVLVAIRFSFLGPPTHVLQAVYTGECLAVSVPTYTEFTTISADTAISLCLQLACSNNIEQ